MSRRSDESFLIRRFQSDEDGFYLDLLSVKSNVPATTTLQDWDSPEDKGNPQNWNLAKKVFNTAVAGLLGFSVSFASSVYASGIPQISQEMEVSTEVATLGIALYSLGLGMGPLLGAPISEARGRKAVYIFTMPVFFLFTIGAGLSKNITSLLICRFFQAATGAPCLAIGGGTVADMWNLSGSGGIASILVVQAYFLGPSMGPVVGGYTFQGLGHWSWLMWVILIVSGPFYILALFTSESSKKEILRRRAKDRGLAGPPKPAPSAALKMLITVTLFRPLQMLLIEPIVGFLALYCAFAFGLLYAFFTAYPFIFITTYRFTDAQAGLPFIGIFSGTILATLTFILFDKTLYQQAKHRVPPGTNPPPEERLYTSMLGSFGVPISLFWLAWTARSDVHWVVPCIAGLPFGWGLSTLFFSGMAYTIDTYGSLYGASTIAANGFLRYIFGAAFPLFILQMYEKLGIAWATSTFAFLSLLMLPIPWILYRWGPALRARSKFKM